MNADMLTGIAACGELFHTATGTAFADLLVDGHRESWPIRSKRFRSWLCRRYYEATGTALGAQAISSELDLLEARAQFDAPVRALPREERELMIAANNGYLLAFDNLSGLPTWLSDALCRLASGGSFAVRQLYTDDDEVLFQAARPLLVNGIEDVISRADLADRGIFLTLAPIGEQQRRSETELWREFEIARPHIL